jgi:glycosyltransferase involved in cell wall biosynthesis
MAKRNKSAVPEREEPEEKVVSIVKKVKKTKGLDNISSDQRVKAVKPYCPEDLMNVYTQEGALSRSFHFGEYCHPNKTNLQIRGYVDFYGGYAEHTRNVIDGLERTGKFAIRLTAIPAPRDLEPILANKMDWYMSNPAFHFKDSIFMVIAGPGHLRKDKLPDDARYKIGWTMIETLDVQPDTVKWLDNVDEIYAPTKIDVERFKRAGVERITWMPLGYDPNTWHPYVPPMDIANVRNRYVFGYVGSWNVRKSVQEIVKAYITEFSAKEPVSLLMCTKYGTRKWGTEEMREDEERWCIRWELEQVIKELGIPRDKVPHICIMDIPVHPSVLPTICARFDSIVGFSKGESTWLPGIEVGAMKKPIIQLASSCSGFMDYLYDNPYMCLDVDYIEADQELYEGTSEYYEGEKLAHGSVTELKAKMRRVYKERDTAAQRAIIENTWEKIAKYTWDRTINMLSDRLHKIV